MINSKCEAELAAIEISLGRYTEKHSYISSMKIVKRMHCTMEIGIFVRELDIEMNLRKSMLLNSRTFMLSWDQVCW